MIIEHNVTTGEIIERELTAAESRSQSSHTPSIANSSWYHRRRSKNPTRR